VKREREKEPLHHAREDKQMKKRERREGRLEKKREKRKRPFFSSFSFCVVVYYCLSFSY
jgi:hypothetical protein